MKITLNFKVAILSILITGVVLSVCFIYIFQEIKIKQTENLVISHQVLLKNYSSLQKSRNANIKEVQEGRASSYKVVRDELGGILVSIINSSAKIKVENNSPVYSAIVEIKKISSNYYATMSNGQVFYGQDEVVAMLEDKRCNLDSLLEDLCGSIFNIVDPGYLRHQSTTTAMIGDFTKINIIYPDDRGYTKMSLKEFIDYYKDRDIFFSTKINDGKIIEINQVS